MDIYGELTQHWTDAYRAMDRQPSPREGFREFIEEAETEAQSKGVDGLQPGLAIFEFGLQWLSYVHIALSAENGSGPRSEKARPSWALTGAAISFGLSIRRLCLSGFDTPARALLRTYVETLFLCIAILKDHSLGEAYFEAETDADVKNFWHKTASPKKLHERIIEIERASGFDSGVINQLTGWRRQEYEILSQSSHLSYVAAALTVLSPKLDDQETFSLGVFGRATANSLRTISYAATTTWYFSRMSHSVLLGRDSEKCLILLDKENDLQQRIVAGRDALSAVTLAHWGDL